MAFQVNSTIMLDNIKYEEATVNYLAPEVIALDHIMYQTCAGSPPRDPAPKQHQTLPC